MEGMHSRFSWALRPYLTLRERIMRKSFKATTKQKSYQDFRTYTPISDAMATAVDKGLQEGPADDDYRLYFGPDYRDSCWNQTVVQNMAKHALTLYDQELKGQDIAILEAKAVEEYLWSMVRRSQADWRQAIPRWNASRARLETADVAAARAADTAATHLSSANKRSRKDRVSWPAFVTSSCAHS